MNNQEKFWQKPSRKWFVAQVVALGGIATSAIESGYDATESKLLVGWLVLAISTYMIPNAKDAA